jgi:hypothetical protein
VIRLSYPVNTMNTFEKPKDWGVAPQTQWVSGTPIGQGEIRMPELGDPGAHEGASAPMSFGDDGGKGVETQSLWQGKMVSQCPPGTSSKDGICTPDPKSEASPETKMETVKKQFMRDTEGAGDNSSKRDSFKREVPKAPETDPQIRRISKEGYKGRQGGN